MTYKRHDKLFRFIFYILIFAFFAELSGGYLSIAGYNNSIIFNIYILISVGLLSTAGIIFLNAKRYNSIIFSLLAIWEFFWIYRLIVSPIEHFSNNSFISGSALLVLLYVIVLVKLIYSNKPLLVNLQYYLVCIAILIYYSGTIPTFGLLDYLMEHYKSIAKNLYYINFSLSTTYYSILSYAFYLYIPKKSPDKNINNAAV